MLTSPFQESQLLSSEREINPASDHQQILPITKTIIPHNGSERKLSEDDINQLMNECLPINDRENRPQGMSNETEIPDPGEEVTETANEICNLQEEIPEQEKMTPPDPNLINELYDQFKLKECDDCHFFRIMI